MLDIKADNQNIIMKYIRCLSFSGISILILNFNLAPCSPLISNIHVEN